MLRFTRLWRRVRRLWQKPEPEGLTLIYHDGHGGSIDVSAYVRSFQFELESIVPEGFVDEKENITPLCLLDQLEMHGRIVLELGEGVD